LGERFGDGRLFDSLEARDFKARRCGGHGVFEGVFEGHGRGRGGARGFGLDGLDLFEITCIEFLGVCLAFRIANGLGAEPKALCTDHVASVGTLLHLPKDSVPVGLVRSEALHERLELEARARVAHRFAMQSLEASVDVFSQHEGEGLLRAGEKLVVLDPKAFESGVEFFELA
jgi:hypothetical protein